MALRIVSQMTSWTAVSLLTCGQMSAWHVSMLIGSTSHLSKTEVEERVRAVRHAAWYSGSSSSHSGKGGLVVSAQLKSKHGKVEKILKCMVNLKGHTTW